ncbi:hypothetical protein ACFDTO_35690 [Microbacteriaceae bacterium 4G12]
MLVGQGSDGDYNGDSSALYQSKYQGETWEYVTEVKKWLELVQRELSHKSIF